jgi:hypothetical protein
LEGFAHRPQRRASDPAHFFFMTNLKEQGPISIALNSDRDWTLFVGYAKIHVWHRTLLDSNDEVVILVCYREKARIRALDRRYSRLKIQSGLDSGLLSRENLLFRATLLHTAQQLSENARDASLTMRTVAVCRASRRNLLPSIFMTVLQRRSVASA